MCATIRNHCAASLTLTGFLIPLDAFRHAVGKMEISPVLHPNPRVQFDDDLHSVNNVNNLLI